jgi:hypothetical protein
MASSSEILASPHEVLAGPGQREHWADNLRVLVIAVVVVWHTAAGVSALGQRLAMGQRGQAGFLPSAEGTGSAGPAAAAS